MADEFCITCHANLTQKQAHSESCKFLQSAEAEQQRIKDESNIAIKKAQEEFQKTLEIEKDKITKEAKQQLLDEIEAEKQKIKELKLKKNNQIKESFIKKILQFDSEKQITPEELEKLSLDEIVKYYQKIIKIHVADSKMNFKVTCLKCGAKLGQTVTEKEAEALLKSHNKKCPKKSNAGNWIMFGIAICLISSVAFAFVKSNPHLLKKPKEDETNE